MKKKSPFRYKKKKAFIAIIKTFNKINIYFENFKTLQSIENNLKKFVRKIFQVFQINISIGMLGNCVSSERKYFFRLFVLNHNEYDMLQISGSIRTT